MFLRAVASSCPEVEDASEERHDLPRAQEDDGDESESDLDDVNGMVSLSTDGKTNTGPPSVTNKRTPKPPPCQPHDVKQAAGA